MARDKHYSYQEFLDYLIESGKIHDIIDDGYDPINMYNWQTMLVAMQNYALDHNVLLLGEEDFNAEEAFKAVLEEYEL
jgi:hypothetical protein